jgi:pSer/pThr/pTyr-binding forkhead associated (FHA) protein
MTTSAAGSDQTPKKLVISDGSGSTRTVFLTRDLFSIGRELDNDISLDDLGVSRYHAHIKRRDERFFVEDLASANGTTVNGVVISEPRILRTNDTIGIGSYDLRFDVVSDSVPAVVVPPPSATPPRVQATQVAPPAARSRKWWLWLLAGAFVAALVLLIALVVGGWLYIGS